VVSARFSDEKSTGGVPTDPDIAPLEFCFPDIPGKGRIVGEDCFTGGPGTDG
jgi:hypothetical protein